jgi:2,4-dienoyl-CoA reductase-like NADH-dependent reductase (Old Yellow Enzyme family)
MSTATHSPFRPFHLAGLTLRNRVIKAATYEGMTPGARVSEGLVRHHRELGAGGVAMTTVAYCAVSADGRTFRDQLYMRADVVPELRRLTDAVHSEGAAAALQLGHCGAFCDNQELVRSRPMGPSSTVNMLGALHGRVWADAMQAADIERTTAEFVQSAKFAREAGFDAVELHLGHGYLLSQFLSPATNRRSDAFGGSLENRARFPLAVVERVRHALPVDFPVLVKLNLCDGFTGGLTLTESVQVARWLEGCGASALVLSGGFVSRDAFYLFRGDRPLRQMIEVQSSWAQKLALFLFGPFVIRAYPYEPLYFLPMARQVRRAVSMPLVLLGGVKSMDDLETAMREGFELAAMARALIHDPMLIAKYEARLQRTSDCIPCNQCVAEMDRQGGVRCVRVPAQLAQGRASVFSPIPKD